eukprot:7028900-Prymnesium_polylepis.1
MAAVAALLGGWAVACRSSVAQTGERAVAFGCPVAFTPPTADDVAMSQLCPATCLDAGIQVQGCALVPAAPPAPPTPPASPPMPPHVPGPSGFTTVGTTAQLREAIDDAPSGSMRALFLPPGQVFDLDGSPIVVGPIELQMASAGKDAVLDAQHRSRVLELQSGALSSAFVVCTQDSP